MQPDTGAFYIIPSLLSPESAETLPGYIIPVIRQLHHFFVENERTARRFLKSLDKTLDIDTIQFSLVDTHHAPEVDILKRWLKQGVDVGLLSEAGYPCIADPGSILVREAHRQGARVIPMVGPNAMLMALAASGLNGQQFRFSGYLPVKEPARGRTLRELEKRALQTGETQIFMETPYRNRNLLQDILTHCHPDTLLCIAVDITAPAEQIQTRSLKEWARNIPDLHKRPAVFVLGRN
jgi:16S rRNA (cytidine1402-2'-O)-methyltransferase